MRRILHLGVAAFLLSATGCASFHSTTQGVLAGGLFGAAVGVAATAASGGSLATGALIGGVVGAAAGGYVGCMDEGRCK